LILWLRAHAARASGSQQSRGLVDDLVVPTIATSSSSSSSSTWCSTASRGPPTRPHRAWVARRGAGPIH